MNNKNCKVTTACLALIIISLFSCEPTKYGYKYEHGELPDSPVNLEEFNTEYDDYNATAPTRGLLIPFCFSTNRNSNGENFDVIYQPMNVNFNKTSGVLTVKNEYGNWGIYEDEYKVLNEGLDIINTTGNEFGPNLIFDYNSDFEDAQFVLLYASDINGDLDINFIYKEFDSSFSEIHPLSFLNSEFNDAYPTITHDNSNIFFCSDREDGIFNIFSTQIDYANNNILPVLTDTSNHDIAQDSILSSAYDDKCPYVFEDFLVFTSNRPGGFGGFDLYYSRFVDGEWTIPVNFGEKINSEYDEYRPILFEEDVDPNKHMMVFSSNRTGGKGGFDLYFVGVDK